MNENKKIENSGFVQTAKLYALEGFKNRLKTLRKEYKEAEKEFNKLCNELERATVDKDRLDELTFHLTAHLAELDVLDRRIKEVSETIKMITLEFSN